MTVATTGGAANPWDSYGDVGLEDVSASDIQIPRLVIDHETATFKDPSTGQNMPGLTAVVLGMVKQRIMWDDKIDEGDKPQCKSPDHLTGYPQMRTDIPARKQFPWGTSNFTMADYPPDENGQIKLPCDACTFTKWGADNTRPSCSEQFTYILFYSDPDGNMRPGLCSFQRSGAKAARSYAASFHARRQPMFTAWTNIALTPESRGKTRYATPSFSQGGPTDSVEWPNWVDAYRSARAFLHEPPRPSTKEEDDKASAARARTTPASAAAATQLADDDPWNTAPAANPAPQAAAPPPPPARPAAAPPPPPSAPVGVPASPDDDLPF